ncbi:MAG: stage II sporulation protein D [Bacilli bacterium]|nr:stage II sporulation protein D [Bacilli bacterium]
MRNKYLLGIVFVLLIIAVISSRDTSASFFEGEKDNTVSVYDPNTEKITDLDLEEYVIGVVAAEMPASFNEEALKAQAIAARTYAMYKMKHTNKSYDVIADVSNQAYITTDKMKEKWKEEYEYYYSRVKSAVEATQNLIMTYDGEVIQSYYFAMSNGHTEDAALVFGENKSYLTSVDSSWDENVNNFIVTNNISKSEFCQKLNISCNGITIGNVEKSSTGRVNSIVISGKSFQGTEVRQLLGLRSTDFEIVMEDNMVNITTKGYGHGVGMSQYGANEMAKKGYKYDEILKYYYKNIEIRTIHV